MQEFYTSPETNIKGAQGQDALVSLVGTIGSGLTWSGSIFVNPLIGRYDNVKLISLVGAFVMSTGIVLASFATQVCLLISLPRLVNQSRLAPVVAAVPDTGHSLRHWLKHVLLSPHVPHAGVL